MKYSMSLTSKEVRNSERLGDSCIICNNSSCCSNGRVLYITRPTGKKAWESSAWEPPAWAPPNWEVVQPPKGWEPLRWQEAVNHIKSNTDYASYLVMTVSPHIIADSYGDRYIVGSFKNISSVELDHVSVISSHA